MAMNTISFNVRGVYFKLKISAEDFGRLQEDQAKAKEFTAEIHQKFLQGQVLGTVQGVRGFVNDLVNRGLLTEDGAPVPQQQVQRQVVTLPLAVQRVPAPAEPPHPVPQQGQQVRRQVLVPVQRPPLPAPGVPVVNENDNQQLGVEGPLEPQAQLGPNEPQGDDDEDAYIWSDNATRALIREYGFYKDAMTTSTKPKIIFFNKIAATLHKRYPPLAGRGAVVQRKWRKLVTRLRLAKKKRDETGQGGAVHFHLFQEMEDVMRGDPRYEPAAVAAAGVRRMEAVDENVNQQLGVEGPREHQLAAEEVDNPPEAEAEDALGAGPGQEAVQQPRGQQIPQAAALQPRLQQPAAAPPPQRATPAQVPPLAGDLPHKTLRRAAVTAMRDLNTTVGGVREELSASNAIQRERNDILRQFLLGRNAAPAAPAPAPNV